MKNIKVVVIGASAGGIDALKMVLPAFKKPSKLTVFLVLHLPPQGPNLIPELFQESCEFKIKEVDSGETFLPETIYVAAPDYHLSLEESGTVSLSTEPAVNYSRPSIDVLFESAAISFKSKAMGILLTGANHDGAAGLMKISEKKGQTVVQDPSSAEFPTMPASAISLFKPDHVLNLTDMKKFIMRINHE